MLAVVRMFFVSPTANHPVWGLRMGEVMGPIVEEGLRAVLFVGPQQKFAQCLTKALKNELEELDVVKKQNFKEVFHSIDDLGDRTALIVIDETLCDDVVKHMDALRRSFPTQVICMAFNQQGQLSDCVAGLVARGVLRSFLPMNLRLDIWIAAVQLMINGGDYMPPELMATIGQKTVRGQTTVREIGLSRKPRRNGRSDSGNKLTAREIDVLELVAKGCQNKIVAAELNLSQHTVKLHMHNIIGKLGVANRTEAAAIYLGQMAFGNGVWSNTG